MKKTPYRKLVLRVSAVSEGSRSTRIHVGMNRYGTLPSIPSIHKYSVRGLQAATLVHGVMTSLEPSEASIATIPD